GELPSALALEDARARFGKRAGTRVWRDFRSANDPEAPTTIRGRRFTYEPTPRHPRGVALPDPGSLKDYVNLDASTTNTRAAAQLLAFPAAMSNALVVSARRSASGDTFAVPLCNPNGGAASIDSGYYLFRGRCLKIEVRQRKESWKPNAGDQTPPGSATFTTELTPLGIVTARARVHGRPVIYTKLRSTYLHEPDSGLGLSLFNQPGTIRGPADFQRAASLIGYDFNWFYVDSRHTD